MKENREILLSPSASVKDAVAAIERGSAQIALVIESDKLIGMVTDGDVRRGLLRGESLDSPVVNVMQRSFRSLPASATLAEAMALMQRESLHQIPALDDDGKVVDLFLLDEIMKPKSHPNTVVIMAGGEGKRLRPLTQDCPKPMLRVAGKPLLEIILMQCLEAGFKDFYFAVNYLKEQVTSYFQDGSFWGANIRYLEEKKPLGTAGALSLLPHRLDHPILVLNGDVLTRVDYTNLLRFHTTHKPSATLCVRQHATQIPYGVVRVDASTVISLEEKPVLTHYVNAGIYLLSPDILDHLPNDVYTDMPQLLESIASEGKLVSAFPVHEYWLDIGHPDTLALAESQWSEWKGD